MLTHDLDTLTLIPPPSSKRIAIRVTSSAERALKYGHPWLFDQAIRNQSHEGNPGDLAVVFNSKRKFLAIGLYDPLSPIRVRVLQHRNPASIDRDWFGQKLKGAAKIRESLPPQTTGYRLVHGENDGLPGLVIDRYAKALVIKLYTTAWLPHLKDVLAELTKLTSSKHLVLRLGRETQKQTEWLFGLEDGSVLSEGVIKTPVVFLENGLHFEADLIHGQKTGFFLDQRENRARVEDISKGKSVLNVFAYTGGFSVYAARGGAKEVTSVDISKPALSAAKRNFKLNQENYNIAKCKHHIVAEDAFQALEKFIRQGQQFDIVIIDPPSFAKNQKEIRQALNSYQRLTQLGLQALKPGGILVQASCSSRIDADSFFHEIHQTGRSIRRPLREIERTYHPLDHPIGFKEGAYLKCLFATG